MQSCSRLTIPVIGAYEPRNGGGKRRRDAQHVHEVQLEEHQQAPVDRHLLGCARDAACEFKGRVGVRNSGGSGGTCGSAHAKPVMRCRAEVVEQRRATQLIGGQEPVAQDLQAAKEVRRHSAVLISRVLLLVK